MALTRRASGYRGTREMNPPRKPLERPKYWPRVVLLSGLGVSIVFLLSNAFFIGIQFLLGILGLRYFLWPERIVAKFAMAGARHISVREIRRFGILMWLLLTFEALLRIYDLFHPHGVNG